MAKKSTFKRLMKVEKGLPKSGVAFLKESKVSLNSNTLIAGWAKGDLGKTRDFVVVLQNIEDETFLVVSPGKVEKCDSIYQAFLAHKAARFQ